VTSGVAEVRKGPVADALDHAETAAFLEAKLRCDLRRAEIDSLNSRKQLEALAVTRSIARIDLVLAFTLSILLASQFIAGAQQPGLMPALIAIFAITCACAAAGRRRPAR
jgi:hypothetical protein